MVTVLIIIIVCSNYDDTILSNYIPEISSELLLSESEGLSITFVKLQCIVPIISYQSLFSFVSSNGVQKLNGWLTESCQGLLAWLAYIQKSVFTVCK